MFFFCKQKTAYELRISDWSSDVCSSDLEQLQDVCVIVRACHERWDGQGYPDKKAGDEIPLEARIIFACDAFHAMTTDRHYRRALPQIGRASCGERVCPYVSSSVVAASFKNKHKKKL